MGEVVQFPVKVLISDFMAEEFVKGEMRQHLGAAAGLLYGSPTLSELGQIIDHLAEVARQIDQLVAVRQACGE